MSEHYQEAVQLLKDNTKDRGSAMDMSMLAEAQVHATLALAGTVAEILGMIKAMEAEDSR
jgi:hypothetical protein